MSRLVGSTEMYLKAVFESWEDGIVPRRMHLIERFGHRAATVSQKVARLERDGLLTVPDGISLGLSERGLRHATRVVRKHRLAEVLLSEIVGLDGAHVHGEASRLGPMLSDAVERRILSLCGRPRRCPHGNPVPGLDALGVPPVPGAAGGEAAPDPGVPATTSGPGPVEVLVRRVSERLQDDAELVRELRAAGIRPGAAVTLTRHRPDGVEARVGACVLLLDHRRARGLFVSEPLAPRLTADGTEGTSDERARSG